MAREFGVNSSIMSSSMKRAMVDPIDLRKTWGSVCLCCIYAMVSVPLIEGDGRRMETRNELVSACDPFFDHDVSSECLAIFGLELLLSGNRFGQLILSFP